MVPSWSPRSLRSRLSMPDSYPVPRGRTVHFFPAAITTLSQIVYALQCQTCLGCKMRQRTYHLLWAQLFSFSPSCWSMRHCDFPGYCTMHRLLALHVHAVHVGAVFCTCVLCCASACYAMLCMFVSCTCAQCAGAYAVVCMCMFLGLFPAFPSWLSALA